MTFRCGLACLLALAATPAFAQDTSRKTKDDPAQIGNRDVGKGVNFYSLEKERALGRQLAQEVERQAKIIDDQDAARRGHPPEIRHRPLTFGVGTR